MGTQSRLAPAIVLALLISAPLFAAPTLNRVDDGSQPGSDGERIHLLARPPAALTDSQRSDLAGKGVDVLNPVGDGRVVIRVRRGAQLDALRSVLGEVSVIDPEKKMTLSARRESARAALFARVNIVFHQDVTFEEAQGAIANAGGSLRDPLQTEFGVIRNVKAYVPVSMLPRLTSDDRVLVVSGPAGAVRPENTEAANLSTVPPVQQPPYGLSGSGVEVSVLDCGSADANHPEFQGRVVARDATGVQLHPTHVSGTIAAAGVRADAKGMAPAARIEQFDLKCGDSSDFEATKQENFPKYGIRVDNNSWSYVIGWHWDSSKSRWDWEGTPELFGSYTAAESAVLDGLSIRNDTAIFFSAGNDGTDVGPTSAPFPHTHDLGNKIYCYSANGSGTDCPVPPTCDSALDACEITRHPPDGMVSHAPYRTIGITGSAKNIIAVGALDASRGIGAFSSRGPTQDGRVKPDLVAQGINILSTTPGGGYGTLSGTSMSTPVATGIGALVVEQWRHTMGGDPPIDALRAVLVNGADDLGNPGPDYDYGFGLVDAKASVDLILNDGGRGDLIRRGVVAQGQTVRYAVPLAGGSDVRATLAWTDPEIVLVDETSRSLVNDLDVVLRDPSGVAVLPYVLDPANPERAATRGVNRSDNVEEIELRNAPAGIYTVEVTGTSLSSGGPQAFTLITNPHFTGAVCTDRFEPNDTPGTAWGNLLSGVAVTARSCSAADVDFYRFVADRSGPVVVSVTAADVPLRLTVTRSGETPLVATVNAGTSGSVQTSAGAGTGLPIAGVQFVVEVEPLATAAGSPYQLSAAYGSSAPKRRHGIGR